MTKWIDTKIYHYRRREDGNQTLVTGEEDRRFIPSSDFINVWIDGFGTIHNVGGYSAAQDVVSMAQKMYRRGRIAKTREIAAVLNPETECSTY